MHAACTYSYFGFHRFCFFSEGYVVITSANGSFKGVRNTSKNFINKKPASGDTKAGLLCHKHKLKHEPNLHKIL